MLTDDVRMASVAGVKTLDMEKFDALALVVVEVPVAVASVFDLRIGEFLFDELALRVDLVDDGLGDDFLLLLFLKFN
jgi:hypothetical protein